MAAAGQTALIPPKSNRNNPRLYDKVLYEARHLIENFFRWTKQFRGIATRYDKTATNFLAAFHMVAALCWLNWRQALDSAARRLLRLEDFATE
jgi:transposase